MGRIHPLLANVNTARAERARKAGYPERFAQEALGHNSKAVHRAYAKKAEVVIDSLEQWERKMKEKVVKVEFTPTNAAKAGTQPEPVAGSGG